MFEIYHKLTDLTSDVALFTQLLGTVVCQAAKCA